MKRPLYFFLSFTWALPLTLIGLLCALALILSGKKVKKTPYGICFPITKSTGVSLGVTVICDKEARLLPHETGHCLQNALFGPFMIVLISLPSAVRFWHRRFMGKRKTLPPYDSVWFEKDATERGKKAFGA